MMQGRLPGSMCWGGTTRGGYERNAVAAVPAPHRRKRGKGGKPGIVAWPAVGNIRGKMYRWKIRERAGEMKYVKHLFMVKKQFISRNMGKSSIILLAGFVMLGICSILAVALISENLYSTGNLLFALAVAAIILIGWFIVRGKPAQVRELFDLQAGDLLIDLPYDDTFDQCMRSLQELPHTITVITDRRNGVIEANQKSFMDDLTDWSVIIRFSVTAVAGNKTRVSMTTDITTPGIFNPGQHLEITKKIHAFLLRQSQEHKSRLT